jgi:non-ribosomal peptide synthetase component F
MAPSSNTRYRVSFTAGGLLYEETMQVLEFLSPERIGELELAVTDNSILRINSQSSRKRIIQEIQKRYKSDPLIFRKFDSWTPAEQRIALFYLCLKSYRILFDFHFDIVLERWLSRETEITLAHIHYFFDRQAAHHPEIETWAESTRQKVATVMLRMLRESGLLLDKRLQTPALSLAFWKTFLLMDEAWFLQACLLNKQQREEVQNG